MTASLASSFPLVNANCGVSGEGIGVSSEIFASRILELVNPCISLEVVHHKFVINCTFSKVVYYYLETKLTCPECI